MCGASQSNRGSDLKAYSALDSPAGEVFSVYPLGGSRYLLAGRSKM